VTNTTHTHIPIDTLEQNTLYGFVPGDPITDTQRSRSRITLLAMLLGVGIASLTLTIRLSPSPAQEMVDHQDKGYVDFERHASNHAQQPH